MDQSKTGMIKTLQDSLFALNHQKRVITKEYVNEVGIRTRLHLKLPTCTSEEFGQVKTEFETSKAKCARHEEELNAIKERIKKIDQRIEEIRHS